MGPCPTCNGDGYVVDCCDDMCHGSDECIHGDDERVCPACDGEGYFDDDEREEA